VSVVQRISDHVYWLPPAKPDRPSLCAVVGEHATVMLDAGASASHARVFLDALSAEGVAPPIAVVLTHSDWDHVFGASEVGAPVIAHRLTDIALAKLAATDWSDEALDKRVASGERSPEHAANIKAEIATTQVRARSAQSWQPNRSNCRAARSAQRPQAITAARNKTSATRPPSLDVWRYVL